MSIILPKLGKLPYKDHPRHLRLSNYTDPSVFADTPAFGLLDWRGALANKDWGLFNNDKWGICGPAGFAHHLMAQSMWCNYPIPAIALTITQDQVTGLYVAVTAMEGAAFNPDTGVNDNGVALADLLAYAKINGFAGRKILAFGTINFNNAAEYRFAKFGMGGTYNGYGLPISAQSTASAGPGATFSVPATGPYGDGAINGWGGHCMEEPADGRALTWGGDDGIDEDFRLAYQTESWWAITDEWMDSDNARKAASGFDYDQAIADAQAVSA